MKTANFLLGCILVMVASQGVAFSDTFTVTNTSANRGDTGSLPWALAQANARAGLDTIAFDIAGDAPHVIEMKGEVLWVNDSVHINGNSQPGYSGSPLVYINGGGANSVIQINKGTGSTISGLQLYNFRYNGISIYGPSGASNVWIRDNQIGFAWDATSGSWFKNNQYYYYAVGIVAWESSKNVIRNNVISGVHNGISLGRDPLAVGYYSGEPKFVTNVIIENFIGTTPDGRGVIGNNSDGIFVGAESGYNWIGDNLISGNDSAGVEIMHPTSKWNMIYRNKIGTDVTGEFVLGNGELGVLISNGSMQNVVGGPWGGNTISGNAIAGIVLGTANAYESAVANWVENNYVGCSASGKKSLGNQLVGIHIGTAKSYWNTIRYNTVGGNTYYGILLEDTVANTVTSNWVGSNWNLSIALGNGRHGIYLLRSSWNTVTNTLVAYNGWGSSESYWKAIENQSGWYNSFSGNYYYGNKNN